MKYDFYAELASLRFCPESGALPKNLANARVDGCTVWFAQAGIERAQGKREAEQTKAEVRTCYMNWAKTAKINILSELAKCFDLTRCVLQPDWLALAVSFTLKRPWYSKDDRPFHVLDNPVRKDRVFGVPYMAAASWKGMLRWACRMQEGLREYLRKNKGKFDGWQDPDWITHLFGNEQGEEERFHRGALVFYPTWFDRISFEVINPHSRKRRAGTKPIYYEVVPAGVRGTMCLLYAPWPGMEPKASPRVFLPKLFEAMGQLLTRYGISAKRTAGWGTAKIDEWKAYGKGKDPVSRSERVALWNEIQNWFDSGGSL